MRKILCMLSLFSCLSSDAILTVDGYKKHISNFRSDVDLLKGYILCDFENILEEHRMYGNFKPGIRGRNSKKGLSYQDQGNDAMTRLVIQLFPSVGGHLNPEGTGSFTNLIMLANENNFSEIELIVGMFQLAQDVRSQEEVNLEADEQIKQKFDDITKHTVKDEFSKLSLEDCLRFIDLLKNSQLHNSRKDQISKKVWKLISNRLKDASNYQLLVCFKRLSECKHEDVKSSVNERLLRKIVYKYFGSIENQKLWKSLSELIVNIIESIDSENTTFKGEIDHEKYPQNYTNYVIAAYAWRILNNNQLEALSKKLQKRLNYTCGSYVDKFLSERRKCFPFGDGRILDHGGAYFQGNLFPDCAENVIKQFIAMLLYSIDDDPGDDRLPNTETGEKIRKFFAGGRGKIQEQALSNTNRSEWVDIVSNIQGIKYCSTTKGLFYEIDSKWEHILGAICVLFKDYRAGSNDGTKIYERKYKAQKTIEDVNQRIKNSQINAYKYIKNNFEEILNDILGIRTDVKLSSKQKNKEEVKIYAALWEENQKNIESVSIMADEVHSFFEKNQKKKKFPIIYENEWIDSLLNNRHKATKDYNLISKFTAARHQHLKQKIFPEALARRFLFDQIETADLMKILKDYTEQEQIEVIKSIYDHAYVQQFMDLFYNPQEIIKKILEKIPEKESGGKTPGEALLRYYIVDSGHSATELFDKILKEAIEKKDIREIKNFLETAFQIYENMDLIIDRMRKEDKERPMIQPKGSETLLDYMLFAVENIACDDLKNLKDRLVMTLDLFDVDHLIGSPKLENLVKKLQNLYKPEEKTYCLNEYLKRSVKKIRLMSHIARLTYDEAHFLLMSSEDEFITIAQAKNLFLFNYYDEVLERVNPEKIKDNLPIILTNALSIYDLNKETISATADYSYPLKVMRDIGKEYLPHISVEKAKSWIDINPILIHLFNKKNTDIPQIFDYFLKLLGNGIIPTSHLSWFSSFVKSARENISDEQMNKLFAELTPAVKELIKRRDFKSVCEDLFDTCINTGKRGVSMLKFLSTHCGQVGLDVTEDKFSELAELYRNGKGKSYKDEEMDEYLKINV